MIVKKKIFHDSERRGEGRTEVNAWDDFTEQIYSDNVENIVEG